MSDLLAVLQALQGTPIPNLLVVAGFVFLFLAFVGRFGAFISLPQKRQLGAGIIGVVLLLSGIGLFMVPKSTSTAQTSSSETTAQPTIAPTAPPTAMPTTPPTVAPTTPPTVAPTFVPSTTPEATPTAMPKPTSTPTQTPTSTPSCRVGDTFIRTSDAMVMMCVPSGTFQMGSETGSDREKPVHEVTLDSFWIDRTEVTNSQYAQCVEAKQCHEPLDKTSASRTFYYGNPDFAHYPVSNVRWIDAQSYCAWVGGHLPTEAQWEYAARGPKDSIYPWGNDPPNNQLLNYNKAVGNTTEVGSYPQGASWVGALDMAGNDWEWVNDWQGAYPDSPQTNPIGPGSGQFKLLRGGSWFFPGDVARTTFRAPGNSPDNYGQDYGFRCVAAGLGK